MINMTFKNELWTATSGDLRQKRTVLPTPEISQEPGLGAQIVIDPADRKQAWLGVGAAITDATASLIWKQTPEQRHALLSELFSPEEGGFSLIRIPLGSCDFGSGEQRRDDEYGRTNYEQRMDESKASSSESLIPEEYENQFYSYDDVPYGQHDSALEKFSIGEGTPGAANATKDLRYIVPVVQEILKINPAVKVLASPWSAPAWMKTTGKMAMGGRMRFGEFTGNGFSDLDRFEGVYAQYFVRYLSAYRKYGIPIYGLTIQNEPSNAAAWPAMIWDFKELAHFGYRYLRPALDKAFPETKLYFWDGSLNLDAEKMLDTLSLKEARAFDGFAFHVYEGPYENLLKFKRFNPDWELSMTERRCMMEDTVEDASHIMMGLIGNWLVRQGVSSIFLWNLALDERGLPNIAGSTGRRGVVTIDHSSGKVQRNLEYYMLRNFGQDVVPGSIVVGSTTYTQNGYSGGLGSVAFMAPDGSIAAQLYNPTDEELRATVKINGVTGWQSVTVPAYGTVSLHKTNGKLNQSHPRKDEQFKLNPYPINHKDDMAPGKE